VWLSQRHGVESSGIVNLVADSRSVGPVRLPIDSAEPSAGRFGLVVHTVTHHSNGGSLRWQLLFLRALSWSLLESRRALRGRCGPRQLCLFRRTDSICPSRGGHEQVHNSLKQHGLVHSYSGANCGLVVLSTGRLSR
jgi:hypothetical protein